MTILLSVYPILLIPLEPLLNRKRTGIFDEADEKLQESSGFNQDGQGIFADSIATSIGAVLELQIPQHMLKVLQVLKQVDVLV